MVDSTVIFDVGLLIIGLDTGRDCVALEVALTTGGDCVALEVE